MDKRGNSVTVAWNASSVEEWFNSTMPLKLLPIKSDLAMRFRKRYVKGFIVPGANNLYIGATIGNLLFGVLGFQNPSYGDYDLLMKADTTPSEWEKSTDLLLFALRSNECKKILEAKFNREISTVYSMAFSLNETIGRYRKHAKLITKKRIIQNKPTEDKKLRIKARSVVNKLIRSGDMKKKPCATCGVTDNIEAHHPDYLKPEAVEWYCIKHHHEADIRDGSCYELAGYNLGYLFKVGEFSLKEAKAQFIQKSWKK